MAGKSTLLLSMLKERQHLIAGDFDRVYYCSPSYMDQSEKDRLFAEELKKTLPQVEFHKGIPNYKAIAEEPGSKLIILDDLSNVVANDPASYDLFTSMSSHYMINVCFLTQSLYVKSRYLPTLVKNCSQKIVFLDRNSLLDLSQLSKNSFPALGNVYKTMLYFVHDHYPDIFNPYILIDNSSLSVLPPTMRIRSNVLRERATGKYQPVFFSVDEK